MNGKTATTIGAVVLAAAGMVLPALAAPGPVARPVVVTTVAAATASAAPSAAGRTRQDRPIVMLVCREARGPGRQGATRAADLACVTRWAGF